MNLENKLRWIFGAALVCLATSMGVFANPPGQPDVQVEVQGPTDQFVYTPYVYTIEVKNVGNRNANGVTAVVDLPQSGNSPTPYVLGRVSSIDSKCSLVNTRLECSFGRIRKNRSKTANFTFVLPVSTRNLAITATGSVNNDANPNNNSDTLNFVPKYSDLIINGPVNVINQHCTGSPTLSSFYECVLAPTSVTDHPTTLNGDGTISFQVQGYTGNWSQPTNKELVFDYYSTAAQTTVLNFHGYAVSANCFEGLSTFPNNPNYVSPYKVCIQ